MEMENEPIFIVCDNCEEDFALVFNEIPEYVVCDYCGYEISMDDLEEV